MTVNQIMRSYVKEDPDNRKRSYNRNAIHAELFSDVAKQVFAATQDSSHHQQNVEKIFGKVIDNIHIKFMNIYSEKENVDKEWKIFYATYIVPLKVLFGIIEINISDNLSVSKYTVVKLSQEQKEALVSTGLNKPMLNETIINRQLNTLTNTIVDCINKYGVNDKLNLLDFKRKVNLSKNILINTGMVELKIENFVDKENNRRSKRPNNYKKNLKKEGKNENMR